MIDSDWIVIMFLVPLVFILGAIYFCEWKIKAYRARLRDMEGHAYWSARGYKIEPQFSYVILWPKPEQRPIDIDRLVADLNDDYKRNHQNGGDHG